MTTINADTTALPFCPEDGNEEDAKVFIKGEILDKLTPVKDRARDMANALRLRHSVLEKPYTLDNVIENWLNQNYDTDRFGLPCWNSLLTAVAEPNGGANKALAKRLAAIYKPGVHSVEPSIPKTKLSSPKQEMGHQSPLHRNNQPNPLPVGKPISESSDESSIDTTSSSSYPSSSTTSGSSYQSTSTSGSSSCQSSNPSSSCQSSNTSSTNSSSTFDSTGSSNVSSGTACSEGSSHAPSTTPRGSEGFNVRGIPQSSGYPPTGYPPTGYPPTGYPPTGYPAQQYSPNHPPQGGHQRSDDEEDYHQQEASDTGSSTSSAMVTASTDDNQNFSRESEIAEDGLRSLGKKFSVVLPSDANGKFPGLLSYDVAEGNYRGYALVINNIRIDGREERQGAHHDGNRLSKTLKSLKYRLVGDKVHENCTAFRMKELFEQAMGIDHTHHDSFICCILSHGDTEFIYGTDDKKVWLSEFGKDVTKCKSLIGKPKIFFVQACRGTLLPDARRVQVDDDGILQGKVLLPEACDVFFGYATSPNTKACRFTNAGSWYIIELCRAFEQYSSEDLMTIVQIAQYNVCTKKEYHYTREENGVTKTYRQSPQIVSTLIKKFYFH